MKKLMKYLKPYWLLAVISPLMMVLEVLADLILPFLTSFLVNYGIEGIPVTDPEQGSAVAYAIMNLFGIAEGEHMQGIVLFGILMLLVTVIGGFFGIFCAWTAAKAAQGFGNDLRRDAFASVMSLSVEQTDRFTTGSLVTRMTNDISMVVDFVEQLLRMFVRAPMFLVGGTVALVLLNVKFSVVLLCAIPIMLILAAVILARAIPMFGVIQKKLDRVNSVVEENVNGARVVKAYVREDYECERFERANRELKDKNYQVLKLMVLIDPFLTIIMNFAIVAVIGIGGWQIHIGAAGMSTGAIMAAITYITQVIFSVMMVTMLFQSISRAMASAKRVTEVLETVPVICGGSVTDAGSFREENHTDAVSSKTLPGKEVAVSFRNVCFRYPGTAGNPVLKDISLDIGRGEVFAIIGATGSGKTSLVSLIPRFYDATEGEVRIDGIPVREYDLAALRKKIGFVMQKSELFSDTVANNIKWGKPDATPEEVTEAAGIAQASAFIGGFAEGYDSFIAEKGASLSGGQKQRMSIARAMVRKPEILILDDSTSALDLVTEAKLQASLREHLAGTTVIMIAQRIASVKNADRIAVIESDGSIRHCAPHDELLRVSETYRDICNSQNKNGGAAE